MTLTTGDLLALLPAAAESQLMAIEPVSLIPAMPGIVHRRGWIPPDDLTWDTWLEIGEGLQQAEESLMWLLGDWWRYGEKTWPETCHQGLRDAVKDLTGYALQTVKNAAVVAGAFPNPADRMPNIAFSYHASVASLPAEERGPTLEDAVSGGWNRDQLRQTVQTRKRELYDLELAQKPKPRLPASVRLLTADARALPLPADSVDLIITSPPYALDKAYAQGDLAAPSWRRFIYETLMELLRVTRPGGRLALNVPLDTTLGGFRPTYAQAVAAAQKAGWAYRTTVVWVDDQLGKSTARGSYDAERHTGTSVAPHVIAPAEMVILLSNGDWRREEPYDRPSDLQHADWLEWTNGIWRFPGETNAWEGHPAPFPVELPRRLIYLLSFPGDVVLDPFLGSGTTALAAAQAGRTFIGVDIAQQYVDATTRRLGRVV